MTTIQTLCTRIWETGKWPEEWKKQELIMLHKSGNTQTCENYRTIALISHTSKIMLIVLLKRLRKKIEEELWDFQAGFRSNRGTSDMLFTIQILMEKVRAMQTREEEEANWKNRDLFITFIDYSKAFDNVSHQHPFDTMEKMGFPEYLACLLKGLYTDQKATIRWNR